LNFRIYKEGEIRRELSKNEGLELFENELKKLRKERAIHKG
jgi:hypothetical protein